MIIDYNKTHEKWNESKLLQRHILYIVYELLLFGSELSPQRYYADTLVPGWHHYWKEIRRSRFLVECVLWKASFLHGPLLLFSLFSSFPASVKEAVLLHHELFTIMFSLALCPGNSGLNSLKQQARIIFLWFIMYI